jgi:hypothetical protein
VIKFQTQNYGSDGWLAWIDSMKGMCASGFTEEEAINELVISLNVKLAYDLGIELTGKPKTAIYSDMKSLGVQMEKEIWLFIV